jgi:hypothetical protein
MPQTNINATENPEAAAAAVADILERADESPQPEVADVPDCNVTLPAGLIDVRTGDLITDAVVRELTGEDEEAIARAGNNPGRIMDTVLLHGVESIGNRPVTRDILDVLLAGDRDALIVGVRVATFGSHLELGEITCPHCEKAQLRTVDLVKDLEVSKLPDPKLRKFEVKLRRGKAFVSLPTGEVQRAISSSEDRNPVVLNNILLRKCVTDIDGMPVVSEEQIKKLGIADRQKLIEAILDHPVGPRLGAVKLPCEACHENIDLALSFNVLFRL